MKKCKQCQIDKELSEFGKNKYAKDGLLAKCKICRNADLRQYNKDNPDIRKKINDNRKDKQKEYYADPTRKRKYKNNALKQSFGISIEDYEKLQTEQNNLCAICNQPQISTRNKCLAVDHCHITGKIRGLLCDRCNRSIGLLNDDVEILKSAIIYLEYHNENKST